MTPITATQRLTAADFDQELLIVCDASRVRAALPVADVRALSDHLQQLFAGSGTFTLGRVRDMLSAASVPHRVVVQVQRRLLQAPTEAVMAALPSTVTAV